jgi:hypothetical protein
MLQDLLFLATEDKRCKHGSSTSNSLGRQKSCVICIACCSLGSEDKFEIVLFLLKDFGEDKREKRGQLFKVILQWRSCDKKLELGWNPNKLLVSLRLDVLKIVAFVVYINLQLK